MHSLQKLLARISCLNVKMNGETKQRFIIFDTDMGADDAWALQMILKAEKSHKNVKVLAITTTHGNTTVENAIKNTYRILDGLDRNDVRIISICFSNYLNICFINLYRFQFIKEHSNH